jgi:hypothetical protein
MLININLMTDYIYFLEVEFSSGTPGPFSPFPRAEPELHGYPPLVPLSPPLAPPGLKEVPGVGPLVPIKD